MRGERVHLARFARAVERFPTPIGFFNNLVTSKAEGDALDLKKGGIFPIVHGVRALSLEKGLTETGTAARIARLSELGAFEREFARELTEALHYLMTMRLDAQIAEQASTSLVEPGELSTMERDLLRDAFQATKRLREMRAAPLQSGDVLMLLSIKRRVHHYLLRDPAFRFLFDEPPPGEAVSIDCETTGLNTRQDDIVTIAAIPIRGSRILTSERFEAMVKPGARMKAEAIKVHRLREGDVAGGRTMDEVLPELLRFIGSRPLVGYYLEFDLAMINKHVRRMLGIELPNARIEVSGLYYERKYGDAPPGTQVDLRFAAILADLGLPILDQHDAFSDALMTAMMYLALRDLKARNIRIPRQRAQADHPFRREGSPVDADEAPS